MSQSQGKRSHRQRMFAALWLLAALLIAGSARAPNETVRVLDGRGKTVLEPQGTWTVPVLNVAEIDAWASWPFWLFVGMASLLLAMAGRQMLAREVPPALVFVVVTGLALLARAEHLGLAVIVFITSSVLCGHWPISRKALALLGCLGLSMLATIEFGFVLIVSCLLLVPEFWISSSNRARAVAVGALILCVGVLWNGPAFAAALLRPIRWIGQSRPDAIFSEGQPAFSTGQDWRAELLLLLFFVFCWVALLWKPEQGRRVLLAVCFLTLLGFGHAGYLWISGLTLALVFRVPVRSEISPRIGHAVLTVALVFDAIRFLPQLGSYLDLALGEATPPVVKPAEWGIEGRVMLLDLSQSVDWQHATTRESFQLLMDDRAEVFAGEYENYAAVCRDMREILADSYLREDLEWGGYQHWLNEWSPALLVANSSNLWDIRRLSLSPHWRVMGIDARRTIFGYAKDPRNYPQSAKALGMMTQLEWPPLASSGWPDNVIAASTPRELLQVSRVLNALRFPYAALRLLPEEDTSEIRQHRVWCHLEIAHRVYRHSGQGSLLDQYRGVHGLRQLLKEPDADPEDILRGLSSLEGLGRETLANQLAQEWTEADTDLSEEQREQIEAFQSRTKASHQSSMTNKSDSDTESTIRQAILEGDREAAESELEHLETPLRDYYALIVSAWDVPAPELMNQFSTLLESPDFPEHRRGEALFYQGCLALEAGNSQAAVSALRESGQVEPESPFHALRQMYRLQMGDR